MNKKQILFDLINEKKVDGCTILGIPTSELLEYIVRGKNIMTLFEHKDIEMPYALDPDGLEHTYINVYLSRTNSKLCSITISSEVNITVDLVEKIMNTFFTEIIDLYQFDILPYHIDLINSDDTSIRFEDILLYINRKEQQKEIAEKLNISKQLITELKKERKNMSITTLSSFIREYPLMPWFEYLRGIVWEQQKIMLVQK